MTCSTQTDPVRGVVTTSGRVNAATRDLPGPRCGTGTKRPGLERAPLAGAGLPAGRQQRPGPARWPKWTPPVPWPALSHRPGRGLARARPRGPAPRRPASGRWPTPSRPRAPRPRTVGGIRCRRSAVLGRPWRPTSPRWNPCCIPSAPHRSAGPATRPCPTITRPPRHPDQSQRRAFRRARGMSRA